MNFWLRVTLNSASVQLHFHLLHLHFHLNHLHFIRLPFRLFITFSVGLQLARPLTAFLLQVCRELGDIETITRCSVRPLVLDLPDSLAQFDVGQHGRHEEIDHVLMSQRRAAVVVPLVDVEKQRSVRLRICVVDVDVPGERYREEVMLKRVDV